MENAINGALDLGADAVGFLRRVFDEVRPGVDAAVPVVKQAGSKALELASPIVAGASKQAQDSFQSAGIDPAPALNAAKVRSFLLLLAVSCTNWEWDRSVWILGALVDVVVVWCW